MPLYYEESGDKKAPMLLFLHGGGVSSWMWDHQVRHFTDYHCVTVDLPEHGLHVHSDKFSIEDSAQQVIELIEEMAAGKRVTVIGFSLGAQVLVQILSSRPALLDGAVINSALVKPAHFAKKLITPMVRVTFPLIKNRAFSKLQANTLFIGEEYFEHYYNESCQMEASTLIRILKENMSFRIPAGFKDARSKILVTVGEKEKTVMKQSAFDLVNSNANCTGVILSEIGHGAPLAHPDLFNQLLESFLTDARSNPFHSI